jgi:hypothetical protein
MDFCCSFSVLDRKYVRTNTDLVVNKIPEFEWYYVACLKDDPAKEPIAMSYCAPGVLADAAHKTGRAKADLELVPISREEHEQLKAILQL